MNSRILRKIKSCKSNLKSDPRGEMLMMVSKYLDKRLANHVSLNHQKYHTKPHIQSKEDMEFQAGMNVLETINDTMCMKNITKETYLTARYRWPILKLRG